MEIEGRIELTGRRGRRRKQRLGEYKETRGYWKLKKAALDFIVWRTRFGRCYGPVLKTDFEMNEKAYPAFVAYVCENCCKNVAVCASFCEAIHLPQRECTLLFSVVQ